MNDNDPKMPIPSHSPVQRLNSERTSTKEKWSDNPTPTKLIERDEPDATALPVRQVK